MMKHTIGPWFYSPDSGLIQMDDRTGDDIQALVATVNFENTDKLQADADGKLIAAAPDMLAALRRFEKLAALWKDGKISAAHVNALETIEWEAQAAIAKATA